MRIEKVEVSHFRGLVGPVTVELEDGLNVIHGPNEAGKSTLAEAIWNAMAVGAKGNTAHHRSLVTHGGTEAPRVTLILRDGNNTYEITKTFGGHGSTQLTRREDDRIIEDLTQDAAEQTLQALLGLGAWSRGALDTEAQGAFPLCWVRQGDSGMQPGERLNQSSRASIQTHLADLAGEAIVGEQGARIYAAAKREYGRYYTSGGAERGGADAPLSNARTAAAATQATREQLRQRVEAHGALVQDQQKTREKLETTRAQVPQIEANRVEARTLFTELERVAGERANREHARKAEVTTHDALTASRDRRTKLRQSETDQVDLAKQLAGEVEQLERRAKPLARDLEEAQGAATTKRTQVGELEQARASRGALAKLAVDVASLRALESRLDKTKHAQSLLAAAQARLDALSITKEKFELLETLSREARERRIKLDAAAASIELVRHEGVNVRIDGSAVTEAVGDRVERTITSATTIEVGELVTLTIRPGGVDLADLGAAAKEAELEFADALRNLGVASLPAAQEVMGQRQQAEQEVVQHEQAIQLHAEDGVSELSQAVENVRAAVSLARQRLEDAQVDVSPALDTDDAARSTLEEAVHAAETEERAAREDFEKLTQAIATLGAEMSDINVKLAECSTNRKNAADKISETREMLEAEIGREGDDATLDKAIGAAAIAADAAARKVAEIDGQLADGALDGARKDLEDAERAVKTKNEEIANLETSASELAGELRQTNMVGIHESIAEAEEAHELAAATVTRVETDANAARLLFTTLTRYKEETEKRFREPLEKRIQTLVRLLWPDANVTLDEDFHIAAIERPNKLGRDAFDVLSAGASEQLGLVARLAMAQILAQQQPLVVLLDDSLVVTDDGRLRDMARVINRVAAEVQIIFLTCHWTRQSDLGLSPHKVIDMERLAGATVAAS